MDNSGSKDDAASALKQLREKPVNVDGQQVERQTREGGQPQQEESAQDVENRAGVPDANEPTETRASKRVRGHVRARAPRSMAAALSRSIFRTSRSSSSSRNSSCVV